MTTSPASVPEKMIWAPAASISRASWQLDEPIFTNRRMNRDEHLAARWGAC